MTRREGNLLYLSAGKTDCNLELHFHTHFRLTLVLRGWIRVTMPWSFLHCLWGCDVASQWQHSFGSSGFKTTGHFLMVFSHKYFNETVQLTHSNNKNIRRIYTHKKRFEHYNAIQKYCTRPFSEVPLSVNKKVTQVCSENLNTRGQLKETQI